MLLARKVPLRSISSTLTCALSRPTRSSSRARRANSASAAAGEDPRSREGPCSRARACAWCVCVCVCAHSCVRVRVRVCLCVAPPMAPTPPSAHTPHPTQRASLTCALTAPSLSSPVPPTAQPLHTQQRSHCLCSAPLAPTCALTAPSLSTSSPPARPARRPALPTGTQQPSHCTPNSAATPRAPGPHLRAHRFQPLVAGRQRAQRAVQRPVHAPRPPRARARRTDALLCALERGARVRRPHALQEAAHLGHQAHLRRRQHRGVCVCVCVCVCACACECVCVCVCV